MPKSLGQVFTEQLRLYPLMAIQDAVKLIYQNEFGPGHLVKDEAGSLARLESEYEHLELGPTTPLFEAIGNGLCRLNLRGLAGKGVVLATVNRFLLHTANTHRGDANSLANKLALLDGGCPGSPCLISSETAQFLAKYREQGYPPVHHSENYRRLYKPAYRVVFAIFQDYFSLFAAIDQLLKGSKPITVAIDGMSSAGKTSLASLLKEIYDCNIFHMDDFFLPAALKTSERLSQAGGNVHYERFLQEVLTPLATGEPFSYRPFDCRQQTLAAPIIVQPKKLNIIEGVYSLHPQLPLNHALKVFLLTSPEIQDQRGLYRNGPELQRRFREEWIPLENKYFQECGVQDKCDLVFSSL